MNATVNLLIEIGVEELPTKAVTDLAAAGRELWGQALHEAGLAFDRVEAFATPRRLAWRIHDAALEQPEQQIERKGPSLAAAKDAQGNWTKAALGFADSCGVEVDKLLVEDTPKGKWLMYRGYQVGQSLEALLPAMFEWVMGKLPIAKRMRWGDYEQSFVRPVLTLVVLADDKVWDLAWFGVSSNNATLGHRVHHPDAVEIPHALAYEDTLKSAYVIADHATRMDMIREQVQGKARELGGRAVMPEALVHEVASLSEWPVAIAGSFDERYLQVPQEVLITTMQDNQKTFAVVGSCGKILPHFVAVANLESLDPASVSRGNEKVIRPRFADAEFFWQQDLKRKLEDYLPRLENVIYQAKLGSVAEKTRRIGKVAAELAPLCGANSDDVALAAKLSKCDLLTEMVMEFPELQGLMGRYYAQKEGLAAEVAAALEEQYFPVGAGGMLPKSRAGLVLALAEKFDTLIGGFAIGAKPTGSKDPYALRRMAIGVIRLILDNQLTLPLDGWLAKSAASFDAALDAPAQVGAVRDYILERLQGHYREQGIAAGIYQAVRERDNDDLLDIDRRVQALAAFAQSAAAAQLLASAKRIRNILRKNGDNPHGVKDALLAEAAEQALWQQWQQCQPRFAGAMASSDYGAALDVLGELAAPLDAFFTDVMVMSDDTALRDNRLALLTTLQQAFAQIADLSLVQE
ncbi:MAG: glycine--tRNA ligase subunit beta [Cardiobacteriaceae bacterium]|nr:glycine--tRNA ligase subunit beta [Cardiobacteriaceae bacterium]